MFPHHTASFKKQKRKAEESGGKSFGLAPFYAFVQDFNPSEHHRTRSLFHERAPQYLSGLLNSSDRRNLEKITERVQDADYQALHHFVTHSPWDDRLLCADIARCANALLGGREDSCLLIDPTALPKKGNSSVGVSRQYCGTRGKIDNCQLGIFSALSQNSDAVLINKRLYLPKDWAGDRERCEKAGIPIEERGYKTNHMLALELIKDADRHGVSYSWIGLDAEFGTHSFLLSLAQMGKQFMVDVKTNTHVYLENPRLSLSPKSLETKAFRYKRKPVQVASLRRPGKWRKIVIRHSSKGEMVAEYRRFAVWLWNGKKETTPIKVHLIVRKIDGRNGKQYKYSLCNAPEATSVKRLAYQQSQRFWIEQAIKECKDGLGMDEYQVRKWKAWHHHVALTMLAGLFLQKLKLEHRGEMPLLSVYDLKEILAFLIPTKVTRLDSVLDRIHKRHQRRIRAMMQCYRSQGSRPPDHLRSFNLTE